MVNPPQPAAVARYSPWIVGWFKWYVRGYLRKHFHSVAVCKETVPRIDADARLVVYLNHASWWDPLVAIFLAERFFAERKVIAPFEAEAIKRYPMFERMGFFGVDRSSRRGAVEFLRTAVAALDEPGTSLWMTPEGRFCDPRDNRVPFEPGLAHLATKLAAGVAEGDRPATLLPLAIEYPFWEESLPEVLIRFGEPVRVRDFVNYDKIVNYGKESSRNKGAWGTLLEERLRTAQVELAELSLARRVDAFEVIHGGKSGVGGLYEQVRRLRARLTGKTYQASHGEKLQT
ncbi:MAG: lysophospholipid acyltransferase family protein [Planctomycetota bacterium]